MRFNEILLSLMKENDVKPGQLAAELNISRSMLENFTRGSWEPGFDLLRRIAAYFQVSTDFLLDYHPPGSVSR